MGIEYNNDVIMTKWIAVFGTAILADKYVGAPAGKLPASILNRAKDFLKYTDTSAESAIANEYNAMVTIVSDGGILKALWDMAEAASTGIKIDLKHIYIKQETVEICEAFDVNPYMLNGRGSLLIMSPHGNSIVRELHKKGIIAAVIGHTTDNHDRIILNDGDIRYLYPHVQDELLKLEQ